MSLIQVILLIAVILLAIAYFRWLRTSAIDLLLMGIIVLTGVTFIIFPEITNRLAALLGVGRGADLIFYLCIVGFGFALLILYSKIRRLERKLTELTRKDALRDAKEKQQKDN